MNPASNLIGRCKVGRSASARIIVLILLLALAGLSLLVFCVEQTLQARKANTDPSACVAAGQAAGDKIEGSPVQVQAASERHGRLTLEQPVDPTTAELLDQLVNASLPLRTRRQNARELARSGSDQGLVALKIALRESTPYLRAAIAEGLGECPHQEACPLLVELADDADETTARGAVRGMALRADGQAIASLGEILFNPDKPDSVRGEAALALGTISQPAALTVLLRAVDEIQDEALARDVLDGLGRQSISQTAAFFQGYLDSPAVPIDLKAAALEALSRAEGDMGPMLLKYVTNPNAQLRSAAAWSLSALENPPDLGPQLLDRLKRETDPEVRRRLYQALGNQESCDWDSVITLAGSESDPSARLAALDLLTGACQPGASRQLVDFFDRNALPELKQIALNSISAEDRLLATISICRSETSQSLADLEGLAGLSNDSKVIEASKAAIVNRGRK
jgi:HEAT repeat protein